MRRITRASFRRRLDLLPPRSVVRSLGRLRAPHVSVVVRVRAEAAFLGECLASIEVADRVRAEVLQVTDDAGLGAAVSASRGEYLAFLDADDVLDPGGLAAVISALGGADLAASGRRVLRGPRSMPVAPPGSPVDLSLSGKVVRASFWRTTQPPAGSWERQPVTVAALVRATSVVTVPGVVLAEEHERDVSAPVERQRRFDSSVVAARIGALAEVLTSVPAGQRSAWAACAVAHLMPQLCRDAVAGGPSYATVVGGFARTLLSSLPQDADLPVEARIATWVAAHRDYQDLARTAAWLADHPDGLPVAHGVVDASPLTSLIPRPWLTVRSADRVLRARAWIVAAGGRRLVRGNAFVTYDDSFPEVVADGGPLVVRRRDDVTADEWARRSFEDHSDCGFEADLAVGGSVVVRIGDRSARLPLAEPGPPVDALIVEASLGGGRLVFRGRGLAGRVRLVGDNATTSWADVREGEVSLDLVTTTFGEQTALPAGSYAFEAESTAPPHWSTELLAEPPDLVGDRLGVRPTTAGLTVGGPLTARQGSSFGQQRLVEAYAGVSHADATTTVLFESFRGRSVSDNPAAVARALASREPSSELVWVVDEPAARVTEGSRAVARRTPGWYDALAHAHAYIANAAGPPWFAKKPGQVHLQTWHGTPLKKIGEDRGPGDLNTWRHRRNVTAQAAGWDAIVSPSPYCSEIFRSAFRYDGPMLEVGYPRNDVLLSPAAPRLRDRTRRRLGLTEEDRVVLYAPTWREYVGVRDSKPLFLDAERVATALPDTVVLLRGHYNASRQADVRGSSRIVDVTRYPDIAELYLAADVLVTDYSSVMFDFVLTDRPIVLLTPDLDQYRDVERGFYFDIEADPPGPLVRDTDEVIGCILAHDDHSLDRAAFRERFCPWDDGSASHRVVEWLLAQG